MNYNILFEILIFFYYGFSTMSVKFKMRKIENFQHHDIGEIFADADNENSFIQLNYEFYLSSYYLNICRMMRYRREGAEAFPCKNKGLKLRLTVFS